MCVAGSGGWNKMSDPKSGKEFFINDNGETSYERPEGFDGGGKKGFFFAGSGGSGASAAKPDASILNSKRSAHEDCLENIEGGWKR